MEKFLLEKLVSPGSLKLRAKSIVDGFLAGMHDSPLKGAGLDFAEHREYARGDDLKRLDWKLAGKTDKYYVKQYKEESTLTCYILLDISGSMDFSSGSSETKMLYAMQLAASLSYLIKSGHDKFGLFTFNDKVRDLIPPASSAAQLNLVIKQLESITPSGRTSVFRSLQEAGSLIKKKAMVILISDLYDESPEPEALKYFKYLASRKNEVLVFHILDEAELSLDYREPFVFEGLENGERLLAHPEL
ncbi:MAG: DUF58 domain-containing protein, partial [Candidatus Firestonebacteria bacterium]